MLKSQCPFFWILDATASIKEKDIFNQIRSSSIFYRMRHDTSQYLPVKAEYGYITFTVKGGNVLNFDINNER